MRHFLIFASLPLCPHGSRRFSPKPRALSHCMVNSCLDTIPTCQYSQDPDYKSAQQHDGHRGHWETWFTGHVNVFQDLGERTEMQYRGRSDWPNSKELGRFREPTNNAKVYHQQIKHKKQKVYMARGKGLHYGCHYGLSMQFISPQLVLVCP